MTRPVAAAAGRSAGGVGRGPLEVFAVAWRHRVLLSRLVRREVAVRYRGTVLGLAWAVLTPLLLLAVYTFVFSAVFQMRWDVGEQQGRGTFALLLFAGLLVFGLCAECIGRAPSLLLENVAYIKKVVFPLECLPWVVLGAALVGTAIGAVVLLLVHLLLVGLPPWTAVLLPLVLAPVALVVLGGSWLLAATGLYLRDARQAVAILLQLLLFASPIFYPIEALPARFQALMYLNPLAPGIEHARDVLIFGRVPDAGALALHTGVGWLIAWLGLLWFQWLRRGFADVA